MQLSYDISPREYREAWWLHIHSNLVRKLTVLVLYRAIPALGLLAFYCGWWIWQNEQDTTETAAWVIIGSMWCALALVPAFRMRRLYRQQGMDRSGWKMSFTDDYVMVSQASVMDARVAWRNIAGYAENADLILVYLTEVRFLPVPKRALSAEQLAELHSMLASRLPKPAPAGHPARA